MHKCPLWWVVQWAPVVGVSVLLTDPPAVVAGGSFCVPARRSDALMQMCNDADMPRVISVVNTKGGVGKTTTAVYLATALAAQYRVILLDADPQGSATSWATDAFEAGDQLDFEVRPANAPIVRRCGDIDADLVIIDTPPGDFQTITAALDVADVVIIPTESGDLDMDRALMTYQVAHGTRRALLFNKADRTRQYRDAHDGAAAVEGLGVLDAEVHRRVAYRQAIGTRPTDLGEFAQVADRIKEMLK